MLNLASAATIVIALRLTWDEALVRLGYGLLLNLLAYLTNDYYDVDADLRSPSKDQAKTRFLKEHMRAALVLQIVLALALAAIGLSWSGGLVLALVLGAGNCWAYSARLKHVPFADVVSMIVWGVSMPLVAVPLDSLLGWCLVAQLGLFSACFEIIQVIRDHDEDSSTGTRTVGVVLGIRRSIALERLFMTAAAAYAILVLNRWVGLALVLTPLLAFEPGKADAYWNRVRMIQGLAWLAMIAWVAWSGSTMGLLASVDREAVIALLTPFR